MRAGGLYDLFMLISIVLFVASAVLAAGVFLYVQFLDTQAKSKLEQLQRAKEAFQPALIQKLTRLDDRMRAADTLLSSHLSPVSLFQILQQVTLQTVAYRNLNVDANDPQSLKIKMSGVAQSVNSVALQADLLSKSNVITSPIFTGIARQGDGVHFEVSALVNSNTIRYSQFVLGQVGAAAAADLEATQQIPLSQQATSTGPVSPFTGGATSN